MATPAGPEGSWSFYAELGQLLERRRGAQGRGTDEQLRGQLHELLVRLYAAGQYSTLIAAHWGPFRGQVEDFVVHAAELSAQRLDRVVALRARKTGFHVAYSFFFSRGNLALAGGAMARLAALCEEAAEDLAGRGTYDQEEALLGLLLSARSAWALAATVADIAPPPAGAQAGSRHACLRWGYSEQSVCAAELRRLGRERAEAQRRGDLEETQFLEERLNTLQAGEGDLLARPPARLAEQLWTRPQVLKRYSASRARVLLATPDPAGYAMPGTLSASSASNPAGFAVRPSTLLRFTEPQLLDCLARRGDVDEALAFAGRSRLGVLPIVQALCNRIVLCLDVLLSGAARGHEGPKDASDAYLESALAKTSVRLSSLKPFPKRAEESLASVLRRYLTNEVSEPLGERALDFQGSQYANEIDYCVLVMFSVMDAYRGSSWGHQYYTGHACGDVVCSFMHATVRRDADNRALPLDSAQNLVAGEGPFFIPRASSFRILDILRQYLPDVFSEASAVCYEQVFGVAFHLGVPDLVGRILERPDQLPGGMPADLLRGDPAGEQAARRPQSRPETIRGTAVAGAPERSEPRRAPSAGSRSFGAPAPQAVFAAPPSRGLGNPGLGRRGAPAGPYAAPAGPAAPQRGAVRFEVGPGPFGGGMM